MTTEFRSKKEAVRQTAAEILTQSRTGMRSSILIARLQASLPDIPAGTIRWAIQTLVSDPRPDIYRSKAGFYKASTHWQSDETS